MASLEPVVRQRSVVLVGRGGGTNNFSPGLGHSPLQPANHHAREYAHVPDRRDLVRGGEMKVELKRELGLFTCILLVIGNIIGVGIFMTPGKVAHDLPTAGWVLAAWIVGGLMTTAGALSYGELGAMFPKAGGDYVFLKEAFGPLVAFLYGLAYSLVTTAGTIAMLAIGFAEHLGLDTATWYAKLLSVFVVLVLTFFNYRGVKLGAGVMDVLTMTKIAAMLLLVGLGFAIGHGNAAHFQPLFSGETKPVLFAIAAALAPMAFTYSGWNSTVLVAEEVRSPERLIPLSLILGTVLTTLIYVLMNAVYLYAVPLQEILGSKTVADQAATHLFAPWAANLTKALVVLSVLGCLSATMLSNPRTVFAMGRDGLFFKWAGTIHPKHQTPSAAIVFESIVGCGFILCGSFEQILDIVSVTLVIIFAMTVSSIFVFRIKLPDRARPYKCWGYPLVPALYVIVSVVIFISKGMVGVQGIMIILGGIPFYYVMLWYKKWRGADTSARIPSQ
jgi:basic amino acid/polyamine antiporter, APA family